MFCAYANAIWLALTVGVRKSRVPVFWAGLLFEAKLIKPAPARTTDATLKAPVLTNEGCRGGGAVLSAYFIVLVISDEWRERHTDIRRTRAFKLRSDIDFPPNVNNRIAPWILARSRGRSKARTANMPEWSMKGPSCKETK